MSRSNVFGILLEAVKTQLKEVGALRSTARMGSENESKLAEEYQRFNIIVVAFLNCYLDEVSTQIARGRKWSDPHALLEVTADDFIFRIPVIKLEELDGDLSRQLEAKDMTQKIEALIAAIKAANEVFPACYIVQERNTEELTGDNFARECPPEVREVNFRWRYNYKGGPTPYSVIVKGEISQEMIKAFAHMNTHYVGNSWSSLKATPWEPSRMTREQHDRFWAGCANPRPYKD